MPRFTYAPSRSSSAALAAISLRVSAMSGSFPAHHAPFDALLDVGADFEHAVHVDAGKVDGVGVELAWLDQFLHLGDADAAGHGGERVEVAGGPVEDEVAVSVTPSRVYQRVVGHDPFLEDERGRCAEQVERPCVLGGRGFEHVAVLVVPPGESSLLDLGADAGPGVEAADAGAAGAQPF